MLAGVAHNGGAALGSITRDPAGRVTGQIWTFPSSATIADTVKRSQSGRIVQESVTRGSVSYTSTYGYDGAGRLVSAVIPGHQLTYGFEGSGGCGVNTAAGASGNRTSLVDVYTPAGSATPQTTSTQYCYDWADRLTSTAVTGLVAGANTVADGLAASEIVYDQAGNTTRLADMQFSYDAAGRHAGTTYTGGTTVAVKRDAAGRIVSGTSDPAGSAPASTVTYFFDGAGDVAWGQRTGTTVSRTAALPGGVTVTATSTTSATWSYPSLQGHALATGPGSSTGSLLLTDPYGQPLDAATLAIGTAAADDTGQVTGNTGWHQAALKVADTAGSTLLIEMGARLYVPNLGRFLQVDPIEGGVDNDYTWPTDPIGKNDLTGRAWWNDVLSGSATLVRDLGAWAYENRSFLAHTALSIGAGILTVALTTAVCAGTAGLGCAVAAGAAISMMVQVVPHFALDKAMGVRTSPADAVSYVAGSALRGGIGVPRSIVTKTVVQATKQTAKTVTRVVGGFLRSLVVF